jgi:hypothetical protein
MAFQNAIGPSCQTENQRAVEEMAISNDKLER